jgi:pyridoxamine 5'-phosphate oxidase
MADFTAANDPFALFFEWMKEAQASEAIDPDAMAVATVDADGLPNVRMILLKGADTRGFVFYTNQESAKGRELAHNSKAALLFYWKSLSRQIRIRGPIEPTSEAEADAYFATRHRESRIGACASAQSRAASPAKSAANSPGLLL